MPTGTAESRLRFHELFIPSVSHSAVVCAAHRSFIFSRDNISDGMMTRDTDVLADCVMNALWVPGKYLPTSTPGKEQPQEELNPGKLARE